MFDHVFEPVDGDNGRALTDAFRNGGPNTKILLKPKTTYVLHTPVELTHDGCVLATKGYPSIDSGKQAILETRGANESVAIQMNNLSNVSLKNLHIRGCRGWGPTKPSPEEAEKLKSEKGALGWVEGGGALVLMGGPPSRGAVIQDCRLEDPRGWSCLHVTDFAQDAQVIGNIVGPSGQQAPGPWADGLSIAGRNTIVRNNTVIDATDGGIVIFCAAGSLIEGNTVISEERHPLGGINLVDDFPFDGDYTNTTVRHNTITTRKDGFIRLAIGCGAICWAPFNPASKICFGAKVLENTIGGHCGYGIALGQVRDWTVQGNTFAEDAVFKGNMRAIPNAAPPAPLLKWWPERGQTENINVQDGFVDGEISYLIGLEPDDGEAWAFNPGQLTLDVHGNCPAGKGVGIPLKGGTWHLTGDGTLECRDGSTVLWSSLSTGGHHPVLSFPKEAKFFIANDSGKGDHIWDVLDFWRDQPDVMPHHIASVAFQSCEPFILVKDDGGNIIYATSYIFNLDFHLNGNNFVAIAPGDFRGTSSGQHPVKSGAHSHGISKWLHRAKSFKDDVDKVRRGDFNDLASKLANTKISGTKEIPGLTFLFMSPKTGQLILHSSHSPIVPEPDKIHAAFPPEPDNTEDAWVNFQGDGNLVVYGRRGPDVFVRWASGTNGDDMASSLVITGSGEPPSLSLYSANGTEKFHS